MTRAFPLCGKSALSSSTDSGVLFSIAEIARAIARTSPARIRSTQVCSSLFVKSKGLLTADKGKIKTDKAEWNPKR
jgi:hypothetical protein